MGLFEIQAPDGTIHEVEGPDLQGAAEALKRSLTPTADDTAKYSTGEFLGNAASNLGTMVGGLAQAVRHPVDTAEALGTLGVGAAERLLPGAPTPESTAATQVAKQLGRDVGFNRQGQGYGIPGTNVSFSPSQLAQNFYERPLDVASTLSLPLAGAELLPGKIGSLAGTTSRVLNAPAYAPAKAAVALQKGVGAITNVAKDVPGVGVATRRITDMSAPRLAAVRDLPTTKEFADKAEATYTAAENMGVGISQGSYQNLVTYIKGKMKAEGFDPDRHPDAARELAILEKGIVKPQQPGAMAGITGVKPNAPNTPVSLRTAEANRSQISELIRDAAKRNDKRTSNIAAVMRDAYDNYMESGAVKWAAPRGTTNPADAQKLFQEARGIYRTKIKAAALDEAGYQAELDAGANYTQSGLENALRKRYRNFLRNPAQRGMWTPDEQAAIKAVVSRNPVRPANIARGIGKLAPTGAMMKALTPGLGAGAGGLAGFAAGGPVGAAIGAPAGAAALSAIGAGGRVAATAATKRAVERVQALVRSGKPLPPNSPPIEARIYNALIAASLKSQQQE